MKIMFLRSGVLLGVVLSSTSALNIGFRSTRSTPSVARNAASISLDVPLIETTQTDNLAPEDSWISKLDYAAFGKDVTMLGKELLKETGDADVEHLNKIVLWRNFAAVLGLATVWMPANPVTVMALSTWTYASWTMIAHHTCHGGYNRVKAGRFHSRGFGLGFTNRIVDWLDWMKPEAWNIEHNRLHHYRLNEVKDPDLVQRNLVDLRESDAPMIMKYAQVAALLLVWKWFYYAPNTYKELKINEWIKSGKELPDGVNPEEALTVTSLLMKSKAGLREIIEPRELYLDVLGPMLGRNIAIPGLLCLVPGVGPTLAFHAVANIVLAELLTNAHSFLTIVTNHSGEDMYTFDDGVKPRTGSFYVRQIIGSANYAAGTDPIDFSHGFLNYQIEHHVWPDLSMLQYQRGAPRLKAICEKYGVPYVQESVFERLRKTVDVMVGKTTMRKFPTQYEPAKDKAGVAGVTWQSTNGAIDEK
jgi:hypothetical protein